MLIQLSSAMGYIHSRRLVHRDINPAIILIRQEGPEENQTTLKIADFGMNYMYIDTKTCEVSF
jgi:serine/threonine protein kinase